MTEETFFKQISPIADHDFFYYVAADFSLGANACSRAYINFTNKDDIFIFKDKFDGYIFIDGKGVEYPAVVEFAPFQGLPKIRSRKKDNKCGTIEEDPHFMSFLESLNNSEPEIGGKTETKLEYSYKLKDDKKITSTPLLEFLANKKHERRDDRKRKGDEKRKQRDDDRQKKRGQVAKSMPASIKEEDQDDGIVVRTIRSQNEKGRTRRKEHSFELPIIRNQVKNTEDDKKRGGDRDRDRRKNDRASDRDVKKKTEREREKERKFEKDRERYFERERERNLERERKEREKEEKEKLKPVEKEKEKEKVPEKEIEKKVENLESEIKPEVPKPAVKREVKKYSEVRKERRARAESRQTETSSVKTDEEPKTEKKENELKQPESSQKPEIKPVLTEKEYEPEKPRNRRSEGSRRKDERVDRRIKNKDRPAMQIYRPGKRRDDNEGETVCTTPTDQKPAERERKISFKNRSRRGSKTDEKLERKKSEPEIVYKNEETTAGPSTVETEN